MPRIPRSAFGQSGVSSPQMPTVGNLNPYAGAVAQQAAEGLEMLGAMVEQQQREEADAWADQVSADALNFWSQRELELQQQAGEGATGYANQMLTEWNAYQERVLAGAPSTEAGNLASARFLSIGSGIRSRALRFQHNAYQAQRTSQFEGQFETLRAGVWNGTVSPQEALQTFRTSLDTAGAWMLPADISAWRTRGPAQIHETVINNYLANGQVNRAASYLSHYRGQMGGVNLGAIERTVAAGTRQEMIAAGVDAAWNDGAVPPAVAAPVHARTGSGVSMPAVMPGSGPTEAFYQAIEGSEGSAANAISHAGAVGVMQVLPSTARDIARDLGERRVAELPEAELVEWLQVPENSRRYGRTYLAQMTSRYGGSVALAAAAYNAGPGRVDEWLQSIGDPRTGEISELEWAHRIPIEETRGFLLGIPSTGYRGVFDRLRGVGAGQWAERGGQISTAVAADATAESAAVGAVERVPLEPLAGQRSASRPVPMGPDEINAPEDMGAARVIAWGDSLAVGYGFHDDIEARGVVGAGFVNGQLPDLGDISPGDIVLVSVGANDVMALSPPRYGARLREALATISSRGGQAVVIGMPEFREEAAAFNRMAEVMAVDVGAVYMPPGEADFGDGIHYTRESYLDLAERAIGLVQGRPAPIDLAEPSRSAPAVAPTSEVETQLASDRTFEQMIADWSSRRVDDPAAGGLSALPPPASATPADALTITVSPSGPEQPGSPSQTPQTALTARENAERERYLRARRAIERDVGDSVMQAEMIEELDRRHASNRDALEVEREQLLAQAYQMIDQGMSAGRLPPAMQASLGPDGMDAVALYERQRFAPRTDEREFARLWAMPDEQLAREPLERYRAVLAPADYNRIRTEQENARQRLSPDAAAAPLNVRQQITASLDQFPELQRNDDRVQAQRARLTLVLANAIAAEERAQDRALGIDERQSIINGLLFREFEVNGGLFGPSEILAREIDELSDIPLEDRQAFYEASLTSEAAAAGIPQLTGPNDPRLLNAFLGYVARFPVGAQAADPR